MKTIIDHGLPDQTLSKIRSVLAKYPSVQSAVLFGSRALGRHRSGSDIDLTLVGIDLTLSTISQIDADLDDLLLPQRFDLSMFKEIENQDLREHIHRVGWQLYP